MTHFTVALPDAYTLPVCLFQPAFKRQAYAAENGKQKELNGSRDCSHTLEAVEFRSSVPGENEGGACGWLCLISIVTAVSGA
jgi:hypothetical protein